MAFTSAKMGLRIWNLLTDLYDHSQLADNWAKVDYHDHSPGKGVQIPTEGFADASVTTAKLAATVDPTGAYTSAKPIFRTTSTISGTAAAGTYGMRMDGGSTSPLPLPASAYVVYLDPAQWTASGRTVRYQLRGHIITNAVAPTSTYAWALYPVATWGGTSGNYPTVATIGAAVTGSTTANIAAPVLGGPTGPVSVDFDAPAAAWYMIGLIQTGASAANANVAVFANLFAKQV